MAIAFKPSTFLNFHRAMVQRKYRHLFSSKRGTKPGPKGPTADLIQAVVEMKRRNSTWGCPQIAEQINLAFGTCINKDVVRRILAIHYRPKSTEAGPSWLTFIGHMKDSLWSLDFFCCESIALQTYWVLVVMNQYTRRIVGFGIQRGAIDGLALCRMLKQAIRGVGLPTYVSSDHDPLYRFHQWEANLRILGVSEIKTVPYTPWSHPFAERLIGTIRRECLDRLLFWTATDLEMKLMAFRDYYNEYRSHAGLKGETPIVTFGSSGASSPIVSVAAILSRALSNPDGGMSTNSPSTGCARTPSCYDAAAIRIEIAPSVPEPSILLLLSIGLLAAISHRCEARNDLLGGER